MQNGVVAVPRLRCHLQFLPRWQQGASLYQTNVAAQESGCRSLGGAKDNNARAEHNGRRLPGTCLRPRVVTLDDATPFSGVWNKASLDLWKARKDHNTRAEQYGLELCSR